MNGCVLRRNTVKRARATGDLAYTEEYPMLGRYPLPDTKPDLQGRFYASLCLASALLTLLIAVPINILQALPAIVIATVTAFGLLSLAMYRSARNGAYRPALFLTALVVMSDAIWFPNGGTHGSPPYYYFIAICYALIFFTGAARIAVSGLVWANVLGLILLEYLHPELVRPFGNKADRFVDLAVGFVIASSACVMMLWLVTSGYRRERERLAVAVAALSETEERFARMFQVNPDATYLYDTEARRFVEINDGFTRLTGWTKDESIGRNAVDLNIWVDFVARDRLLDQLAREGVVRNFVTQFRAKDGRLFWGSTSVGLVEQAGRRLVLATTRDVSEQVEASRQVAESRARLSSLIDSTDDLVWLVDPEHFGLITFNQAFAAACRRSFPVEPSAGMSPEALMPAHVAADWRALYRRALEEGPFTVEYTVPGTDAVLLHSFNAVRHDGRTLGVAVFGKDITERKRDERRREQMEVQLFEAQKMESLGSLAGGVAHDFNNMLAGIMGYADLLLVDETNPRRREDLEAILHAATRSSELTRKLLAFGRRGKNIVESVDLNDIVAESIAMLRPSFTKGVNVLEELGATWTVDADPSQLNQLVVNLCINASEAMPEGGTLHLETWDISLDESSATEFKVRPGDYVELRVSDTGVGITDDVKRRLFEPFFTTKLRGPAAGTGLGLSTVYGIVHLHRGSITVDSTPGRGACFTVLLPKGSLAPQPQVSPAQTAAGHGLILVVEDEPLLSRFATTALGKLGYDSITAADGEEGVAVFRQRHAELAGVLLDLKMPKKSGTEAFIAFREIDPAVPVLICSGYGDNEEAQLLISMGARGLLPKPYRISALADMLARFEKPAAT